MGLEDYVNCHRSANLRKGQPPTRAVPLEML